jgi:hypothetical protein
MPEPTDRLAYALYQRHRQINKLKSDWSELGTALKNEWRALAEVAIEFCTELFEAEDVTNG